MINELDNHLSAYTGNNIYDFDNDILLNWYAKRVVELSSSKNSLLELGLGHGHTAKIFSNSFAHHVILDGSKAIIENFSNKNKGFKSRIIETYFEDFDTDDRFEVIVLGFILEHVDDPLLIIKKYKHFLSKNGKMYIAVPNAEVLNRRLGYVSGLLRDMHMLSDNDILLGHKRYYTVESLRHEIETAKLIITKIEGIYLKPFTTSQILSLKLGKNIIDAMCDVGIDYPELSCGLLAEVELR